MVKVQFRVVERPWRSSRGFFVSSQVGKGMYWRLPWESVICIDLVRMAFAIGGGGL